MGFTRLFSTPGLSKSGWLKPLVFYSLISLIFVSPVFKNFDNLGVTDWNYHEFVAGVQRESLVRFHQTPIWNMYLAGGNPLIGNPQNTFYSFFFVFPLVFGEIHGLKILVLVNVTLGMYGVYLLSRHLGLSGCSSYLPPIIYMISDFYSNHMSRGHITWFAMAWVPWCFLYYLKSMENLKYVFISGVFLALTLFEGPYTFAYIILFLPIYSFFRLLNDRNWRPITALVLVMISGLLFSAIKLLPVAEFSLEYPRVDSLGAPRTDESPGKIFSSPQTETGFKKTPIRNLIMTYDTLGCIIFLASAVGVVLNLKKHTPLILTLIVMVIIGLGSNSIIDIWGMLHDHIPFYNSIYYSDRITFLILLCMSIFSGFTLSIIENGGKLRSIALLLLLTYVSINARRPYFERSFTNKPLEKNIDEDFHHICVTNCYPSKLGYSNMYKFFLINEGCINMWDPVRIYYPPAIPKFIYSEKTFSGDNHFLDEKYRQVTVNPDYKGEVFLLSDGDVKVEYFSPNRITVNLNTGEDNILFLNQNYYKGWNARGCASGVASYGGLVSCNVSKNTESVTFFYLPSTFIAGSLLTLLSALTGIIVYLKIASSGG